MECVSTSSGTTLKLSRTLRRHSVPTPTSFLPGSSYSHPAELLPLTSRMQNTPPKSQAPRLAQGRRQRVLQGEQDAGRDRQVQRRSRSRPRERLNPRHPPKQSRYRLLPRPSLPRPSPALADPSYSSRSLRRRSQTAPKSSSSSRRTSRLFARVHAFSSRSRSSRRL